jgi:hypothetical protein
MEKIKNKDDLPVLLDANEIQKLGISRSVTYQLLNRKDVPVIQIGKRKFVNRDKFFEWLDKQGADAAKN